MDESGYGVRLWRDGGHDRMPSELCGGAALPHTFCSPGCGVPWTLTLSRALSGSLGGSSPNIDMKMDLTKFTPVAGALWSRGCGGRAAEAEREVGGWVVES